MSCKCAHFNPDEGRYYCDVSGDQCMYLIPSSKACARDYGEGPDTEINQNNEVKSTMTETEKFIKYTLAEDKTGLPVPNTDKVLAELGLPKGENNE